MRPAAARVAQGWSVKPVSYPGRCALIMALSPLGDTMQWILLSLFKDETQRGRVTCPGVHSW